MSEFDYNEVFEAPYLSGCCMIFRANSFYKIQGFDPSFFLYLEDADITRRLSSEGRCVHLPVAHIVHKWGRGNYRQNMLFLVNIISALIYFRKWGLAIW